MTTALGKTAERRKSREEIRGFIRDRMSCNYVEVPASIFEEKDDPKTIRKLAEAWMR